jgi:RHS repeat-associated protein/uncharacterized repeat protein (TIGR01451 family)
MAINAQSDPNLLVETNASASLNLCGDTETLTVTITNSSSAAATNIRFESDLPIGITVVNSEYTNIGSSDFPIFQIPDIPASSVLNFTYDISGNCELLDEFESTFDDDTEFDVSNENTVRYSLDNGPEISFTGNSESYNIRFAELEVKVADDDVNLFTGILEKDADGTVFTREIVVRNSGLGRLTEYAFYVDVDNRVVFSELSLGGQVLTPIATGVSPTDPNVNRYTYTLADFSTIGNGNTFFEQDEVMTFTDKVSMLFGTCESALETNYTVNWGCNSTICNENDQEATSIAFLSFVSGRPDIFAGNQTIDSGDFCGDEFIVNYSFENRGSNSTLTEADNAFNLRLRSSVLIDVVFSINGVPLIDENTSESTYETSFNNNSIFNTDIDGVGVGLDDLDNDGYFDDLPVGSSLSLEVSFSPDWAEEFNTTRLTLLSPRIFHEGNECNQPVYASRSRLTGFVSNINSPPNTDFPAELTTGSTETFRFTVNRSTLFQFPTSLFNFGNYFSDFNLPEGYVIDAARWIPQFGLEETLTFQDLGNSDYKVLGGGTSGRYELDIRVECADGAPELSAVDWDMYLEVCTNPGLEDLYEIASVSDRIFTEYESCDPNGGGGENDCHFSTEDFNIDRNTFGYVDQTINRGGLYYTQDELQITPRVDKSVPGLKLNAVYPSDEVMAQATGKILSTDVPVSYNSLIFEMAFFLPDGVNSEILSHPEVNQTGIITVDGQSFSLTNPSVTIEPASNRQIFTYEIPLNFDTSTDKDIVVSDLLLKVKPNSEINLDQGVFGFEIFRANFNGINTNSGELGCSKSSKGTSLSLLIPRYDIQNRFFDIDCQQDIALAVLIYSATGGDDFPNEYRPIITYDSYTLTLPFDYTLKENATAFSGFGNFRTPLINTNDINAEEVIFSFGNVPVLEGKFSSNFGPFVYSLLEPRCDGDYQPPVYRQTAPFIRNLQFVEEIDDSATKSESNGFSRFQRDVPFTIEPNATQEGFERSLSWPVLYCNEGSTTINYPWVALELKENDLRTVLEGATNEAGEELPVVFYGENELGRPTGMLVSVTSLAQGTCTTIFPRVTYTNCENDAVQNIDLISSQSCETYPLEGLDQTTLVGITSVLDEGILSCEFIIDEQEVTLRYKTGDLTWEVNRLEDQVDLCEALTYEVKVLSSRFANVYDTELTVELPQGITPEDIANIQYEYDGVIGLVDVANFIEDNTTASNNFKIKVSELVTDLLVTAGTSGIEAGDNTIPGSRLQGKNEITFNINLVADCTMDPGIPVRFDLDGVTNCNDNINLLFNRLFPINGVVLPDLTVDVAASDFLVCSTQNQVNITLANNDPNPDVAQQELRLTLPNGVAYGGVANGSPAPVQNGNVLTWDIDDINTNRTQSFSVFTTLTDLNILSFDYAVDMVQNGQATCVLDAQACNLQITTAQDTDNAAQITLPQVTINPITTTPVCEGTPVTVAVELNGVSDYSQYEFSWNVTPTSQNNNQFTFTLFNATQLQVSVSPIGNNNPTCAGNANLDVEIYPGATINMNLIEGITCAGNADANAFVTILGEAGTGFTEQQPFEIVSASPLGTVTIGQLVNDGEAITVENLPEGPFTISFRDNYGCTFEQTLNVPTIGNPITNFCTSLLPCGVTSGDVDMGFDTADLHSVLNSTAYTAVVMDNQTGTAILNFTGTFPDNQSHTLSNVSDTLVGYTLEITADNGCVYTRPFIIQSYNVSAGITNVSDPTLGITNVSDPTIYELCFANETRDIIVGINDNVPNCSTFTVPNYEVLFGTVDENGDYDGTPQSFTGITDDIAFNGLGVGNYKVTVRPDGVSGYSEDISLCEEIITFNITSRANFTASLDTVNPLCAGEATGTAEVVLNGGSGTFTYAWKEQGSTTVISNGYRAINLPAGDYEVTVTDTNGCPNAIPLTFTLTDPNPLEIPSIEDVQTACEAIAGSGSGAIASGYSSGTAPYVFRWYEIITTTDFEDNEVTGESFVYQETVPEGGVSTYPNITPGDYKVMVTDANGCTAQSLVTEVTQPEVARQYNINLSWSSKVIQENENPNPRTFENDPIGPSNYRQALAASVERCIAETQEVSRANVANFLKDIEQIKDTVNLAYMTNSEVYHYTLYYYDRAGNLVRTVPPAGVNVAADGDGNIARVATDHTYVTGYDYNSISQLGSQNTPDGGTTNFLYNDIGQLLYSQNERQIADNAFSYSSYDELGRIVEAGEAQLTGKTFPTDFLVNGQADENVAQAITLAEKVEYIQTTFNDRTTITYQGGEQRFLRNRVSQIYNLDKNGQESYTYYSYDPHGNVEWIVQDLPSIGQTTVAYEYDLISGNVNEVIFNLGKIDEYHHQYAYDEDNRIISVKTSKNGHLWDEDARYDYYLHGPLARTEIGEDRIQGLDFTYTIHGWLKGINTPDLAQNAYNPDGINTQGDAPNTNSKDEFGMALGYYSGDFARDGVFDSRLTAANPFVLENQINGTSQDLYNGNISTWTSQTAAEAKAKNVNSYLVGNSYQYDQLNRIKEATAKAFNEASQAYEPINGQVDAFKTNYSYDGNGNLQTLQRYKDDGQLMDDLAYNYDLTDLNLSNKLTHVNDGVGQVSAEINDLPNQNPDNYVYDAIGQLVRDNSEGLTYVWNTSGKVSEIIPDDTGDSNTQKVAMKFTYDGMGNRIVKQVNRLPYENGNGPQINNPEAVEVTYYSLDAQGNVMGIYKREDVKVIPGDANDTSYKAVFKLTERPMYGSDRIGQDTHEEEVYSTVYNFASEADYNAVMLQFVENINSVALGNVLVVQNIAQGIFDLDGNTFPIPGTNLATAMVDGEFVELQYNSSLVQDANSTPVLTDNNIFLIEDVEENPLGYGVVASNYFSTDNQDGVMLIYNTNGELIPGLQLINSDTAAPIDYLAKSVVVKNPARNDEFFLFYKDNTGNLHTATLSTASGSLEVTATVQRGSSNYGRHMAVVDDRQLQRAFVYATTHTDAIVDVDGNVTTPPQATLVRFIIDGTGALTEEGSVLDPFESYDTKGSGELQISLDGNSLSLYNYTGLATQWTGLGEAELRTWQLDDNWLPLQSSTQQTTIGGNIGKGSLINTGTELYYTQRTQEVSTNTETTLVIRASDGQVLSTTIGDLRANKNNKFYNFAEGTDTGQEYNLTATNSVSLNNLPASSNGVTGYQPYQPYTINGVTPAATSGVVYRDVGEKYYELKDHLGNVRVVVSDRKNLDTSDNTLSANVVSYNNYYPFGMPQPNRNFDSQEYRYGFQGQEKDSELKGEGLSVNYKYRMHDPRIGRFFATDPIAHEYPWNSPYSFSENRVIDAIELEGKEKYLYIRKQNLGGDVVLKTYGPGDENIIRFIREQIKARTGIYNKGLKWDRTSDFEAFNDESEGINAGTLQLFIDEEYNIEAVFYGQIEDRLRNIAEENLAKAKFKTVVSGGEDVIIGLVGLISVPFEEVGSGGLATAVVIGQTLYSIDELSGGLNKITNPEEYLIKEAKPLKFFITEQTGKAGETIYNIIDVTLGARDLGNIEDWKDVIGAYDTVSDANSALEELNSKNESKGETKSETDDEGSN